MKRIALAVAMFVSLAAPAWAGIDEGVAAYKRGDYKLAIQELTPLAEQGHGDVQYLLGRMYHTGLGVPQDYAEATLWYRRAAEQGNPGCQFLLGFLYSTGRGVPKDLVQAHFWFSVSAARGSDASRKSRERVAKKMTPAQIAEAQRLARELMEKRRGK
jgi:TPR repeat protein